MGFAPIKLNRIFREGRDPWYDVEYVRVIFKRPAQRSQGADHTSDAVSREALVERAHGL